MPKKKPGITIELPKAVLEALALVPTFNGLPVQEYLRIRLLQEIPEIVKSTQPRNGPGRPARPAPSKLPDDIERAQTASGFAGVYQNGRYWKAFWDKGEGSLGVFENAEDAAFARYWYNKGRLSLAVSALEQGGASHDELEAMATQLGTIAPKAFKVGDVVDYDPVIGEGPIKRKLTIVNGPYYNDDGTVTTWIVSSMKDPVRQEDLEHYRGD